jgi:hypothetical protein
LDDLEVASLPQAEDASSIDTRLDEIEWVFLVGALGDEGEDVRISLPTDLEELLVVWPNRSMRSTAFPV